MTITMPQDMLVPKFDDEVESGRKLAIICSKGSLDMAYPGLILGNAALGEGVVEPVGALAAGHSFHRDIEMLAVGLRRAGKRVAAIEGARFVRDLEGQELTGPVLELVGKLGRDLQHEGPCVRGFLYDFGNAQLMISHGPVRVPKPYEIPRGLPRRNMVISPRKMNGASLLPFWPKGT